MRWTDKSYEVVLILILMECLLSACDICLGRERQARLNPYSNGMLTQFIMRVKTGQWISLNPYSNGMLTQKEYSWQKEEREHVLILILMECLLRRHMQKK